MEMFKTRNMILDGAKAATNMSKIRDITWNHENIQREWAKVKIIAKTKIRIKMRLHIPRRIVDSAKANDVRWSRSRSMTTILG